MKRFIGPATVLCAMASMAGTAGAAVISVDFYRGTLHDLTGTTPVGLEPIAAENWNIVLTNVSGQSINDETGTPAASITVISSPWNGNKVAGDTNDNFEMMLTGARGRNNTTTYNDFLQVTGLGPDFTSGYDVILYWADNTDSSVANGTKPIRLNAIGATTGVSYYIDPISYNGSFVRATSTDGSTGVILANYIMWEGVTGSSFGLSLPNGIDSDMALTGLQIVAVPEPVAMSLLAIGGLGMLSRRKR